MCHFSFAASLSDFKLLNTLLVFYRSFTAGYSIRDMHVMSTLIHPSHILNGRQIHSPASSTLVLGYPGSLSSPVPKLYSSAHPYCPVGFLWIPVPVDDHISCQHGKLFSLTLHIQSLIKSYFV